MLDNGACAETDPVTKKLVNQVYRMRLELIRSTLSEKGFKGDDLEMRAHLFICYHTWERNMFMNLSKAKRLRCLKLARHRGSGSLRATRISALSSARRPTPAIGSPTSVVPANSRRAVDSPGANLAGCLEDAMCAPLDGSTTRSSR